MGPRQRSDRRSVPVAVASLVVFLVAVGLFLAYAVARPNRPSGSAYPAVTKTATGAAHPTVTGGDSAAATTRPAITPSPTTPPTTPTQGAANPPSTSPGDPFTEVDDNLRQLVEEQATWQTPASLTVARSQRIGLVIGDSGPLGPQIAELVEEPQPKPAGQVKVGPRIRVSLWADSGDAVVKPSEAVDQSTGSQIALLWTWFVRPLHPSSAISFTAHIEVLLDGNNFSTDVSLKLAVHRTVDYTLHQVFNQWTTLSAIGVALASGFGWLWKRRRRKPEDHKRPGPDDGQGDGADDDQTRGRGDGSTQPAGTS